MDARRLVGWNLRRLRVTQEMTIESLADEAGLDPSFVARVERGVVNSSVDTLDKLARVLGAGLADLTRPFPPDSKAPRPLRSGPRPKQ